MWFFDAHVWRELERVAEHDDLHAAEGFGCTLARLTQRPVHRIQQVGRHHRDLVDDERVDLAQ